jgi:hypothetical protein
MMSVFEPGSESSDGDLIPAPLQPKPSFFQQNKLPVIIASAVLVVALGIGGFLMTRPSPAQPYLDNICVAFDGLDFDERSYNDNKALLDAQTSNLDQAKQLDMEASSQVDAALSDFSDYMDQVSTTNFSIALAMTLGDSNRLNELIDQIDRDSEVRDAAVAMMDAACGR